MGKLEYLLSQKSDAANSIAIPKTATCWICLAGDEDPDNGPLFFGGCACRGGCGYRHAQCLVSYATSKEDDDFRNEKCDFDPWSICNICREPFTGKLNNELAQARYNLHKNLDPKKGADQFQKLRGALRHIGGIHLDEDRVEVALKFIQRNYDIEMDNITDTPQMVFFKWFNNVEFSGTCDLLGGCHLKLGNLDDALMYENKALHYIQHGTKTDEIINQESYILNNIAEIYVKRSEFCRAIKLRRRVISMREKTNGKNSFQYVQACFNLGCVLCDDGQFDEGRDLIKESGQIAKLIFGPLHQHVLKCDAFLTHFGKDRHPSELTSGEISLASNIAYVRGLTSRSDLNGMMVEVLTYNPDTGRYKATRIDYPDIFPGPESVEHIAIKPENLILFEGVKVVLRGLVSAHHLNGKHGEIISFNKKSLRYAVKLCDGSEKAIAVKPENAIAY